MQMTPHCQSFWSTSPQYGVEFFVFVQQVLYFTALLQIDHSQPPEVDACFEIMGMLPFLRTQRFPHERGGCDGIPLTKPLVVRATSDSQRQCKSISCGSPGSHLPALRKPLAGLEPGTNGFVTESYTVLPRGRTVLRKTVRPRG
jgi:hypothetical protein